MIEDKLVPRAQVRERAAAARAAGRRIVFTNGCFDLLHVGHVRYLAQARALGDLLFVAVNSDRSVRELKGPGRPVTPEAERAELLAGLVSVDLVTVFDEPDPAAVVGEVRPDVLVKGGDWPVEKIVGRESVELGGGRVVSLPFVPGRSTTSLLDRVRQSG